MLGKRFWAESLFGEASLSLPEEVVKEDDDPTPRDTPAEEDLSRFEGELTAFELETSDLGFVRNAFNFKGKASNTVVALRASNARVGDPSRLIRLALAPRLNVTDEEGLVKVIDGKTRCEGLAEILKEIQAVADARKKALADAETTEVAETTTAAATSTSAVAATVVPVIVPAGETTIAPTAAPTDVSTLIVVDPGVTLPADVSTMIIEVATSTPAATESVTAAPTEAAANPVIVPATVAATAAPTTESDVLIVPEARALLAARALAARSLAEIPVRTDGGFFDMTTVTDAQRVKGVIIAHTPTQILYGSPADNQDAQAGSSTWAARRKDNCMCKVMPDAHEKFELEGIEFHVDVVALDCLDQKTEQISV